MANEVFISYKSEEHGEALWLKNVLEINGISCWMAPFSIPGGSNYAREIPKAIAECRIFVVLLSNKAQESIWISKELNQALIEKRIVMPYMLEDCALHQEFDFYLSDVQRYDAFINISEALKKMICEIRAILGVSVDEPPVIIPEHIIGLPPKEKSDDNGSGSHVEVEPPKERKFKLETSDWIWLILAFVIATPVGIPVAILFLLAGYREKNQKTVEAAKLKKWARISTVIGIVIYFAIFVAIILGA